MMKGVTMKRICVGLFVLIGVFFTLQGVALADYLDNWHARTSPAAGVPLVGITYGNSTFVAVGESGTILTSPDGVTWTSRNSGTTNSLWGITYANNKFVAVGEAGAILTSPDGLTWTSQNSGTTDDLNGVTYAVTAFIAVGETPGAGGGGYYSCLPGRGDLDATDVRND
jgi:photosystem II stability/assembly factor-like uncharacterized protein